RSSDMTLKVTKLTRHVGAVIEGLDLRTPLSDSEVNALKDALYQNGVIFLRDQDISEQQQVDFTKQLGPIVETAHRLVIDVENTAERPPYVDEWHTDMTNTPVPPGIAVLQGRVIPEFGGDTMWVSLPGIWSSLSPTMKQIVRGLRVRHGLKD